MLAMCTLATIMFLKYRVCLPPKVPTQTCTVLVSFGNFKNHVCFEPRVAKLATAQAAG